MEHARNAQTFRSMTFWIRQCALIFNVLNFSALTQLDVDVLIVFNIQEHRTTKKNVVQMFVIRDCSYYKMDSVKFVQNILNHQLIKSHVRQIVVQMLKLLKQMEAVKIVILIRGNQMMVDNVFKMLAVILKFF